MNFKELGLIAPILKSLDSQGYTEPTPIQRQAIPPALHGRDVLGCAQTGTGKTCAFATPILQRLNAEVVLGPKHIRALILTPTRELALQIQESFESYGRGLPLRSAVIFGGVGQQPQVDKIKRGLDILVATPGRLLDLQGQGLLDLAQVEIFVLDEADRMLDMGFIHDVKRVLKVLPTKKQTLFFSATMPPEVMDLVNSLLHDPVKVAVDPVSSPVEVIDQSVYFVDKGNKSKLLAQLIRDFDARSALIFTRTKHGANKVAGDLVKAGITAAAIHGNKSQTARQQALSDFKAGRIRALVATDIAARGIDIEELPFVFNYNLPEVPETYVHRIGRTGRAGHEGTAISFCDFVEKEYLRGIEKLLGRKIKVVDGHDWPMVVLEAPKDAKGKVVNADDAEARAAARERKKLRDAAKKPAAPPAPNKKNVGTAALGGPVSHQPAGAAPGAARPVPDGQSPAKKKPPRWQKAEGGAKKLDAVLPERTARSAGTEYSDYHHRDPLADDVIMDATARLLAPRRPAAAPAPHQPVGASAPDGSAPAKKSRKKKKPAAPQNPVAAVLGAARPTPKKPAGAADSGAPSSAKRSPAKGRDRKGPFGGGRRGMPPEPRKDRVKDSTEHDSLMKPYYLNDN